MSQPRMKPLFVTEDEANMLLTMLGETKFLQRMFNEIGSKDPTFHIARLEGRVKDLCNDFLQYHSRYNQNFNNNYQNRNR